MADKKITDYTEKTSIVSDDFFEIFDSEEAVISERNKKIKSKNINHDYKIWYVDGDNGDSGNNGSFSSPVKTTQQAIDKRETDGATNAEIRILGGIVSGTVTLASNPSKSTLISGSLRGTAITTINATDTTIRLTNMSVTDLNVTQTGSNNMFTIVYNCIINEFSDTIATVGNSTFWCFNGSRLLISVASSENFDTIFNIEDGSFMDIGGSSGSTWNQISLINRGTLDIVNSTIAIANLFAEKSFIMLADSTALTITNQFDHIGVVFTNFDNIDASSASVDETSGEFSIAAPNFRSEVIKTLSSDVAATGSDRNLIIAAQSGATDDMIELTGLTVGQKVLLRADTGDTITIKHNAAGATIKILIKDNADFILDEQHPLELILVDTNELAETESIRSPRQSFGTWTVESPAGEPTLTDTVGRFVKTGVQVLLSLKFTVPANADASQVIIDNIPFTSINTSTVVGTAICIKAGVIENHMLKIVGNETQIQFQDALHANVSWIWQDAAEFVIVASITYITDEFV